MKKKIILCLLVLVGMFTITGCGNSDSDSVSVSGSGSSDNWDLSLTSKEYANSFCSTLYSEFLTSATTYKKDGGEYLCSIYNPSKDKFLLFEIEGEYTGSSVYGGHLRPFTLVYGKDYEVAPKDVWISIGNSDWICIDGDYNNQWISIDPLEETKFIIRGAFDINSKIETDTSQSLVLKTPFGEDFNLR